ncbi:hypothetical protein [Burkholderia ubonensis]|uniref:hypothetical protein n=1 Tax=Burkholderia ubonensis TaxID=101571 RepID=UPI0012F75C84|nr:hypothetical protein [Burkholderia ubonensis]
MTSESQAVDIQSLTPPRVRFYQWRNEIASGSTHLGFDEWLVCKLTDERMGQAAAAGDAASNEHAVRYRLDNDEFELADGGRYRVDHPKLGPRYFRCMLDGIYPLISFYRPGTFVQLPWLTITGLFTLGELRSLTRMD